VKWIQFVSGELKKKQLLFLPLDNGHPSAFIINGVTISPEKNILERKRALCYIHLCTLYVGFTVRVGVRIR